MKKILFVLAVLPVLLAPSCADDALQPRRNETDLEALDRLVPITQNGAGTFGCLVNGELWIPEVDGASDVAADATTGISNPTSMTIMLVKEPISDDRNQRMTIGTVFNVDSPTPMKRFALFLDSNRSGNCARINLDTNAVNLITVEYYDASSQIISGQFECTFREPDCAESIAVTNGRFDLRYRF